MPKQALMADLQAVAESKNIALNLAGKPAAEKFRVELLGIIDSLDWGILIHRGEKPGVAPTSMRPLHRAKRSSKKICLRRLCGAE